MKTRIRSFVIVSIILPFIASPAVAGSVNILNIFTTGTPAVADEVNQNFDAVKTAVNDNDTHINTNTGNITDLDGRLDVAGPQIAINTTNITTNTDKIASAYGTSYGFGPWINLNVDTPAGWVVLDSLTVDLPEIRPVYVDVDGHGFMNDCELVIAIGIDDFIIGDESTRRFYSFPNGDLDTSGIHSSRLYLLGPGSHTIYFLAQINKVGGTGYYVDLNYMSITALVFGGGGIQLSASRAQEMRADPDVDLDGLILK